MLYYLCAIITTFSALMSCGFAVAARNTADTNFKARRNANYVLARSFSLLLGAIGTLFLVNRGYLVTITGLLILIQALDGYIARLDGGVRTWLPRALALGNTFILVIYLAA
ncbi:hypothetical protein JCM14202_2497 [Agrilactobacillus composti DSM 18527 = JCM 14202]|nr:hypothetical protein [Agrilactobacillus composti]GAF40594.1 hypothetical protein JCM14202_2497 [Agrilactobacillus composti DSM 18527 = JCM 14202]